MSIFSISDAKLSVNIRNFNGLLWLKITADFIITDSSSKRSNPPQATAVIIISWVKLDEDFEIVLGGLETFFNLDSTLFNASDGSMNEKKIMRLVYHFYAEFVLISYIALPQLAAWMISIELTTKTQSASWDSAIDEIKINLA